MRKDGSGSGVLLFSYDPAEPFEIKSWSLRDWSLEAAIHFPGGTRPDLRLEGTFKSTLVSFTNGTIKHLEQLSSRFLPGPLELTLPKAPRTPRFGAWSERELEERLRALRGERPPAAGKGGSP